MTINDVYAFLQALSWVAAACAAVFGVYKYFPEAREKRLWEKARLAKAMVDDLAGNTHAMAASYMLGAWQGRRYDRLQDGKTVSFRATDSQVSAVLDPNRLPLTDNEIYVRECFDELLYHLDLCASAAERGIIDWADIQPLLITLFAGVQRSTLPRLREYAEFSRYYRAARRLEELVEGALTPQVAP